MKFKQINGQNQRIERISPTQLVVGIDVAKETHVAEATNFRGIVLAKRHLHSKTQLKVMKNYNVGWMNYNESTN
jgi:hypothetical protein